MLTVKEVIEQLSRVPQDYQDCVLILGEPDDYDNQEGRYVVLDDFGDVTLVSHTQKKIVAQKN